MGAPLTKGPMLEEALRAYFMKAGYFVVRGVPFVYEGFDVTDIDCWLYGRASSVSREIAIVDIKSKKTPQAIERIFWCAGLQRAVRANRAIVATTDRRQEVKDFGKQLEVLVLDGAFLGKLENRDAHLEQRFSDEEFVSEIGNNTLDKIGGNWKARIKKSKGLLAKGPSFDTCIEWLSDGRYFAEQAATRSINASNALRCLYLLSAFTALGVDHELRELSFTEVGERSKLIAEGFTYGSQGKTGLNKLVDLSMGLVSTYANEGRSIATQVKAKIEHNLHDLPSAMLGDYFSRREVLSSLFQTAVEFEGLAMSREFRHHSTASTELRAFLGCMLDYWGIDRTHLSIAHEPAHAMQSSLLGTNSASKRS